MIEILNLKKVLNLLAKRMNWKDYRKYIIKTVVGPDDYASMAEVVHRRYSRMIEEGTTLPDLILTDGGKGQMDQIFAVALFNIEMQLFALAFNFDIQGVVVCIELIIENVFDAVRVDRKQNIACLDACSFGKAAVVYRDNLCAHVFPPCLGFCLRKSDITLRVAICPWDTIFTLR